MNYVHANQVELLQEDEEIRMWVGKQIGKVGRLAAAAAGCYHYLIKVQIVF